MTRARLKSQRPPFFPPLSFTVKRVVSRVAFFGACVLVVNALIGENGLVDSLRAGRQHRQLIDDIDRLQTENELLRERARRLRDDPRAVAEVARRELGLSAPGERLLVFNDGPRRLR